MSAPRQLRPRTQLSDTSQTHQLVNNSSGQLTPTQPIPAHAVAYINKNNFQMYEDFSKSNVSTWTTASTPPHTLWGKPPAVCYAPATTKPHYHISSQRAKQTGDIPCLMQALQMYAVPVQPSHNPQYIKHQSANPACNEHSVVRRNILNFESQTTQESLVQHEQYINLVTKLEIQLNFLKKQSDQQQNEIKKLKLNCRRKDRTIAILKQQMSWQECKIKRLEKDYIEKDMSIKSRDLEKVVESIESCVLETPILYGKEVKGSNTYNKFLTEHTNEAIKDELAHLRKTNRDVILLQKKLSKSKLNHNEFIRIQKENVSQLHEIGRLKRRLKMCDGGNRESIESSYRTLTSNFESCLHHELA